MKGLNIHMGDTIFEVLQFPKSLRKKCPHSEFFWSGFSPILTEYVDLHCKYSYSVQIRENTDQKNLNYGPFLHSECL